MVEGVHDGVLGDLIGMNVIDLHNLQQEHTIMYRMVFAIHVQKCVISVQVRCRPSLLHTVVELQAI